MNKKEISEINKYCDPYSILVVTNKNKLIRLKCPFKVEVIQAVGEFKVGEIVSVEAVRIDSSLQLIYIINLSGYRYKNFKILFSEK